MLEATPVLRQASPARALVRRGSPRARSAAAARRYPEVEMMDGVKSEDRLADEQPTLAARRLQPCFVHDLPCKVWIDVRANQALKSVGYLTIFTLTALCARFGKVLLIDNIGELHGIGAVRHAQHVVEPLWGPTVLM